MPKLRRNWFTSPRITHRSLYENNAAGVGLRHEFLFEGTVISGTSFTETDLFGAGAIVAAATIIGTSFTETDLYGTGAILSVVTFVGTEFLETDLFGAGAIVAMVNIVGTEFTQADSFGAGLILAEAIINGTEFVQADSFGAGVLLAVATISGSEFVEADSFGNGTLLAEATIIGTSFTETDLYGSGGLIYYTISGVEFVQVDQFGAGSLVGVATIIGTEFNEGDTIGVGGALIEGDEEIIVITEWIMSYTGRQALETKLASSIRKQGRDNIGGDNNAYIDGLARKNRLTSLFEGTSYYSNAMTATEKTWLEETVFTPINANRGAGWKLLETVNLGANRFLPIVFNIPVGIRHLSIEWSLRGLLANVLAPITIGFNSNELLTFIWVEKDMLAIPSEIHGYETTDSMSLPIDLVGNTGLNGDMTHGSFNLWNILENNAKKGSVMWESDELIGLGTVKLPTTSSIVMVTLTAGAGFLAGGSARMWGF